VEAGIEPSVRLRERATMPDGSNSTTPTTDDVGSHLDGDEHLAVRLGHRQDDDPSSLWVPKMSSEQV
jgi:hypothetical protein